MKPSLENRKILVTGDWIHRLESCGDVLACQSRSRPGQLLDEEGEPRGFLEDPKFSLIEGDVCSQETCPRAEGAEIVFHEAPWVGPRSIKNPGATADTNISGFVNMLFAAAQAGAKRFVYASSSSVYGDSETLPKVEASIGRQLSPYAISKYANELFADNFHKLYGIDTVGLRYFNVFGRRQDPSGAYAAVIPKFAAKLLRGEAPLINGDGSNSRDFTYVDNVVQANMLAALAVAPEALNTVYNVAFGERTTLNELFAYLREGLSAFAPAAASIEPEYGPERAGDIPHSLASIDKARRLLGYAPEVDVRSGIRKTAKWYFENLSRP
jgi:UDP-N-acetylglucosamine 4-epimerase